MSAERIEPPNPHGRFRYGSWRGGPDPLAPPYDVRAAVDKIGADLLSAGNLRDSLRELLRRGLDGRGGLDRLAERIARLRAQARRRGDLGGTLDQVRAALDQALAAERETLAGTEGDDARFAEMELDTLPDDVAGAVRALEPYPWRSDEARATYQAILDMLPPGGAGRPVRRDEAGAAVAGPRGDAAGQGHAGRPERPAGGARPQRGHHRRVPRLHGQARRVLPRAAARTSRS